MDVRSEEDLLYSIGHELVDNNACPPPKRMRGEEANRTGYVYLARNWIEGNKVKIQMVICSNPTVVRYATGELSSEEELIKAMTDALGGIFTFVPCGTIALYIFKRGIGYYCPELGRQAGR